MRAAHAVIPSPRGHHGDRLDPARLLPSGRSLLLAFAILVGGLLAYVGARQTAVFSVQTLDVQGAPPAIRADVRRALRAWTGESLLAVDLRKAQRLAEGVPTVESVTLDRAFPHALRIAVVPERPVAVARQGASAYLLSARGRVMGELPRRAKARLARIWVRRDVRLEIGALVEGDLLTAVDAVSPIAVSAFPGRVASVTTTEGELTLRLRTGLEVRLGEPRDADLKLTVAANIIAQLAPDTTYLDVSVPERPVAGTGANPQL